jgi:hypothetical protein
MDTRVWRKSAAFNPAGCLYTGGHEVSDCVDLTSSTSRRQEENKRREQLVQLFSTVSGLSVQLRVYLYRDPAPFRIGDLLLAASPLPLIPPGVRGELRVRLTIKMGARM